MNESRIYADLVKWERVDGLFRVILTCHGTHRDLQQQGIELKEGLELNFWMDDGDDAGNDDPLWFGGKVHYDEVARRWVAIVDEACIRNASQDLS